MGRCYTLVRRVSLLSNVRIDFVHSAFITFTTFFLLLTNPTSPTPNAPLPEQLSQWATLLGVSSALLAAIQYAPQLMHTYKMKLVGALSIPMMCIQSPGAVFMVLSIALRLLTMCIIFTFRQRRLGIDDFGNPLLSSSPNIDAHSPERPMSGNELDAPELIGGEEEEPAAIRVALAATLESAAEGMPSEETPLLGISKDDQPPSRGWVAWFWR
ncbi:hypothetical protein H0H81_004575 [Sphagnurus paluster]|uniref:Transmembrane protein n=1 Tax=Sphagnurus paluster TaxID=117069 RepID=A0A9P7GM52_9AGAR|nr:hypothetical protein H0H81_004575 [Sphagnurus paluster]